MDITLSDVNGGELIVALVDACLMLSCSHSFMT